MIQVIEEFYGNPSSIHRFGRQSKIIIEDARKTIARGLNASTGEIFFTSGATESNNLVLQRAVEDLGVKTIISSPIEHHCILHTLDEIQNSARANVIYLSVDREGHINYNELEDLISNNNSAPVLVSLMHANNEIGTINDIDRISNLCGAKDVYFHCDAAQTVGKLPLELSHGKINFLSGSAHKFFGPKGVGFVYINSDNMIRPMVYGGDQERGMRSGTENLYGIMGMAKAFELAVEEMHERQEKTGELRQYCADRMLNELEDIRINGSKSASLYNILSVSFPPGEKADMLMMNLDILGICASAGSACSSGVENDSHVLEHIGHDAGRKTIRFSFSHFNTKEEVDILLEHLKKLTPVR